MSGSFAASRRAFVRTDDPLSRVAKDDERYAQSLAGFHECLDGAQRFFVGAILVANAARPDKALAGPDMIRSCLSH
jgi:hypothetical protein